MRVGTEDMSVGELSVSVMRQEEHKSDVGLGVMKVGDLAFLSQPAAHRTVDPALFLASTVVLALVKGAHGDG